MHRSPPQPKSALAPFGAPIDNAPLTDDFCQSVAYAKPALEFARPLRSVVPALLLTETLDATDPVEKAREVARGLSRSVLLDIENAPYEALPDTAVQDVVVEFFPGGCAEQTYRCGCVEVLSVEGGRGGRRGLRREEPAPHKAFLPIVRPRQSNFAQHGSPKQDVFDDEGSCWSDVAPLHADSRENDQSWSVRFDRLSSDRASRNHRALREPLNIRISTHSPIPHRRSP